MVLLDPRGRQRWKECVVQPVNTLTQKGGEKKNFLHAAFPPSQQPHHHHLNPPPLTGIYKWRKGGRERRGTEDANCTNWKRC